jgi:SAM-dependent methyltransferase
MSEPTLIFDTALHRRRLRRALRLGPANFLLDRVADDLAERLGAVLRRFERGVDLATPGDAVRRALANEGNPATLVAAHPLVEHLPYGAPAAAADPEWLPFADDSLDLVVSALALHFANDLPGVLAQVRRALRPDGLFLAALLGGDTLQELRQAFAEAEADTTGGVSPHVAPFADVRTLGMLLQRAGFALPVSDLDRITVRYDTPFALFDDLRHMGATNTLIERRRTPMRRATLLRMVEFYGRRFADADGRIRATFDVVWLSGWAPHASQQKPLRPGSATMRLADALKSKEFPTGEKADP